MLLLVAAADVFLTVFTPAAYGGPISRRQNRLIWRAFRFLGRLTHGRARHRWLAHAAPLMAIATLALWLVLVVAGFMLIYRPWIFTFLASPGHLHDPWSEAFLYSAMTATTLGQGDVVPALVPLRFIAVGEAAAGFALLTAVLGYILSIAQAGRSMATLALDIAAHFDGADSRDELAERIGDASKAEAWGEWSDATGRALLESWIAHTRYPILHYYHPHEFGQAITVQLGTLLRFRSAVRERRDSALARHPGFASLARAVSWYVLAVDRYFLPGGEDREGHGGDDGAVDEAYRRLLRQTGYDDGH